MNAAMSIADFNTFLVAEENETLLAKALRQLTKIERPEAVQAISKRAAQPLGSWSGWVW